MWITNCYSIDRPVATDGSLICRKLLWEKCEEGLSYQPINQMNAPVCELEKFVHPLIIVLASNGSV